MKRLFSMFLATLTLVGGISMFTGCEVEVDEGPVEDAAEEIVED